MYIFSLLIYVNIYLYISKSSPYSFYETLALAKEVIIITFDIEKIFKEIDQLRNELNELIIEKGDLQDPEVIAASKSLDAALNEYEYFIKQRNKDK